MQLVLMLNVALIAALTHSFSVSLFLSLHGALTKRPLFILFCQQPKRRGECPPNAIIQSTPSQKYTCFPLSKTDDFGSPRPLPPPPFFLFLSPSPSRFPLLFFFSFFKFSFPSRMIAEPPTARTFPRDECYFPPSRLFVPDRLTGSRTGCKDQLD